MKKSMRWIISAVVSVFIVAGIYIWTIYRIWGLPFFELHFSFSRMVFPFILYFIIATLLIRAIVAGISNKIAYNKLSDEEKKEHDELKAQKIREQREEFEKIQRQRSATLQSQAKSKEDNTPKCPKCGSTSISADKKGFGIGKAVVGAAVAGPIGLAAGNIGSKKVRITCLNCGNNWIAGKA